MQTSNFTFLADKWPILVNLGEMAERNLHQDPNTTLFKLRLFGEMMAKYMLAMENISEPNDHRQDSRLRLFRQEDIVTFELLEIFHALRIKGNRAVHDSYESFEEAKLLLSLSYKLAVWFMQTYGEWDYEPDDFVVPPALEQSDEVQQQQIERLTATYEQRLSQMQQELESLREQESTSDQRQDRRNRSRSAAALIQLNEAETRKIIDTQLEIAGWEVDTQHLTYAKGARPEVGINQAIAEWPIGRKKADYALFVGLKLVGIIEAKRKSKDVSTDLEQAKKYAREVVQKTNEEIIGPWGEYKVPFMFATNGRPYLRQLTTKSGIWFLDARKNTNRARPLPGGWYGPQALLDELQRDTDVADEKLRNEPMDDLRLRDYQLKAIRAVEESIANGQRDILLAMATGTGKTRTTIGLIYRLINSSRFKRVLFLVDRTALGEQAIDAFKETKLAEFRTFTEIFELQELEDKVPNKETKVQIATVQGMVKRILFNEDEASIPTLDQYDCIVVDEAHRGYTLDKNMTDVEYQFRDQTDYESKYRKVLDHFDAVKIGLTATPALHTTEIFGKPVFTYSYREAVIDGYLVDHEPPHQINTHLKETGIKWEKGEKVDVYDANTQDIQVEELPDEVELEVEHFNKQVITENFNRAVLREVVRHLNPSGREKTLIFAATDEHADLVVDILNQELEALYGEVDNSAVMKITGTIHEPLKAIRRFKNERLPNIVVTVDLLTTGIDVPPITNLVFLRRVRSRILYEQMIGRATRLCDDLDGVAKTHFNIFDAVGLYEALQPVNTMKPVVTSPSITFTKLVEELSQIQDEQQQREHIDMILAKLQRKKRRMTQREHQDFNTLTDGQSIEQYIDWMRHAPVEEVRTTVTEKLNLFDLLDEHRSQPRNQFISYHADEVTGVTRGYGDAQKPEDYLDEFARFINENMNKIPALHLVCTRPSDLTREDLRKLRLELDTHNFTELNLRTAWREMTTDDIAADIIAFIRQRALGNVLISQEERIRRAMQKVYSMTNWSPQQRKWLTYIEKQLLKETVLHPQADKAFDVEPFKGQGGYKMAERIFDGRTQEILNQINESLYTTA
ncbi:type I restriction-modification system endonuclease [Tumebacillus permanentifrigoris]|uniref:Type I restriction enzyme R subunit n=1 Tax=Tumebacillus permanentifrigoris TaxID=378543 RepID=A0A316D2F3_9BACL|nr:type I restriction-modification system endonuclease [Tumebacillus permanentifrigoris]PWK03959.1 type I restriction enzyme R subunit [Tumebacillus permanentifrigoris]